MQHPSIKLTGRWSQVLERGAGNVVATRSGTNVITTSGLHGLADYLCSAAASATKNTYYFIAIGTDSTGEAAADEALGTEISRHTGVATAFTSVYQVTATFASGSGTGAIVEYGLLNSNTSGILMARDTEAVINKQANDTLTVTMQLTFG